MRRKRILATIKRTVIIAVAFYIAFYCGAMFVVVHCSRFARRARNANGVRLVGDLVVDYPSEFGKVDARIVKRRNNRDARALKW